jgi:nucleotide-binding universal stress UspA family protein
MHPYAPPAARCTSDTLTAFQRLRDARDRARRIASEHGVGASVELAAHEPSVQPLTRRSPGYGLLVVGGEQPSESSGGTLPSVACALIHHATEPVLVARTPPPEAPFPKRLVVPSDGGATTSRALDLSLRVCAERHATIAVVHAVRREGLGPQSMTDDERELFEEVTVDRLLIDPCGTALTRSSNVGERVTEHARCSVLVAP